MQERAFGLEVEYPPLFLPLGQRENLNLERLNRTAASIFFHNQLSSDPLIFYHLMYQRKSEFARIGARLYMDQDALEVGGPECLDPRDVVLYEARCEALIFEKLVEFNKLVLAGKTTLLSPGILEFTKKGFSLTSNYSYGAHENYWIERLGPNLSTRDFFSETREALQNRLSVFRLSLIPFIGSGHLNNAGEFLVSPRASVTFPLVAGSASVDSQTVIKALAFIRRDGNDTDVDERKFARLQVCSDANVSSLQTEFKLGTTAIILRMIEEGFLERPPVEIKDLAFAIPHVAGNDQLNLRLITAENGASISAPELCEEHLKCALRFFEGREMNGWEKRTMDLWEDWVQKMKKDPARLDKVLDWRILLRLIERTLQEKHNTYLHNIKQQIKDGDGEVSKKARSILYGLQLHVLKYFFLFNTRLKEKLMEEGEMDSSLLCHQNLPPNASGSPPPENSRAYGRFRLLNLMEKHGRLDKVHDISWGKIDIEDNRSARVSFTNRDPTIPEFFYGVGQPVTDEYLKKLYGI